jgi:hypothetical protein
MFNPPPKKYSKGMGCVTPAGKPVTKNPAPL